MIANKVVKNMLKTSHASFSTIKLPQSDMNLMNRDPEMAGLIKDEIERQK